MRLLRVTQTCPHPDPRLWPSRDTGHGRSLMMAEARPSPNPVSKEQCAKYMYFLVLCSCQWLAHVQFPELCVEAIKNRNQSIVIFFPTEIFHSFPAHYCKPSSTHPKFHAKAHFYLNKTSISSTKPLSFFTNCFTILDAHVISTRTSGLNRMIGS